MADAVIAIVDTGPVIALHGIGQLGLLDHLVDRVIVPIEVWSELTAKPDAEEPDALVQLTSIAFLPTLGPAPPEAAHLDRGEAATIIHAMQHVGAVCMLDDLAARRAALSLGLRVRGTLGLIAEAKRRGLVGQIEPLVAKMIENGCRFSPGIVETILKGVGER